MENKDNITVVLPLHELDGDKNISLFNNALKSVSEQKIVPKELLIVIPAKSSVSLLLKEYDFTQFNMDVRLVLNDGDSDFASQMNKGISEVKTEWFSILEFDDEYSINWFKNVDKYITAYEDVGLFMPIIIDTNEKGEFYGLRNEAVWANSFSDELGYLDNSALLSYQNFSVDGIVMKKSLITEYGGFKSNMKLTFGYEFLLRMTFNSVKTMVIPKFGYKHMNNRDNSLFKKFNDEMNVVERNWWLAQAKKEYFFPNQRDITYEEI